MRQDVYSRWLELNGEEDYDTLREANNLANSFAQLQRFEEGRSLWRKTMPVARRVLGESHGLTLGMRNNYAAALYGDRSATLDNLRLAVTTLEDVVRITRRVFGGAHPTTKGFERNLRNARAALSARETPPPPSPSGDV